MFGYNVRIPFFRCLMFRHIIHIFVISMLEKTFFFVKIKLFIEKIHTLCNVIVLPKGLMGAANVKCVLTLKPIIHSGVLNG